MNDSTWSAGTANLLRGEADRLRDLTGVLDDLAIDLRRVGTESWTGRAQDAYVQRRDDHAAQCRTAAVAHEVASRALGRYVGTLEDLAERRRYEPDEDVLARLAEQRAEEASHAAAMLRQATEELASVRASFPELATSVAPVPGPPEPVLLRARQQEAEPPEQSALDPRRIPADAPAFDRRLQELSDAVFGYWSQA